MKIKRFCLVFMAIIYCALAQSQISTEMKQFIKGVEGLSLEVYMDGYYRAVGYGHRINPSDPDWIYSLVEYDVITPVIADALFEKDMLSIVAKGLYQVREDIGNDYPSNVYDVMGSLIYNMGLSGLRSTPFYNLFKKKCYLAAFRALLSTKCSSIGLQQRREFELQVLARHFDFSKGCYSLATH